MGKTIIVIFYLFFLSYMATSEQKKGQFINAYNEYSDEIFRYCFYRVYDREKARELSQETFMKVWKYLQDKDIE